MEKKLKETQEAERKKLENSKKLQMDAFVENLNTIQKHEQKKLIEKEEAYLLRKKLENDVVEAKAKEIEEEKKKKMIADATRAALEKQIMEKKKLKESVNTIVTPNDSEIYQKVSLIMKFIIFIKSNVLYMIIYRKFKKKSEMIQNYIKKL